MSDATTEKSSKEKYADHVSMLGFGMWFALLLLGSFLPEGDISETGRMWLVIIAMTYAVLVLGASFWTGRSKQEREATNADPETRKSKLSKLRYSAVFGFCFMLVFWLVTGEGHWTKAVLQALFFAIATSAVTYLMEIRKPIPGE